MFFPVGRGPEFSSPCSLAIEGVVLGSSGVAWAMGVCWGWERPKGGQVDSAMVY
ncbi:hypothetical protein LY78DRAFT_303176 [Colletotrichum sublineola]|nr:hypothetical protein LY78DRAFT_303176 [Colletotrichum sublineola]